MLVPQIKHTVMSVNFSYIKVSSLQNMIDDGNSSSLSFISNRIL